MGDPGVQENGAASVPGKGGPTVPESGVKMSDVKAMGSFRELEQFLDGVTVADGPNARVPPVCLLAFEELCARLDAACSVHDSHHSDSASLLGVLLRAKQVAVCIPTHSFPLLCLLQKWLQRVTATNVLKPSMQFMPPLVVPSC